MFPGGELPDAERVRAEPEQGEWQRGGRLLRPLPRPQEEPQVGAGQEGGGPRAAAEQHQGDHYHRRGLGVETPAAVNI